MSASDKVSIQHGSVFPVHIRVENHHGSMLLDQATYLELSYAEAKRVRDDLTWAIKRLDEEEENHKIGIKPLKNHGRKKP